MADNLQPAGSLARPDEKPDIGDFCTGTLRFWYMIRRISFLSAFSMISCSPESFQRTAHGSRGVLKFVHNILASQCTIRAQNPEYDF